MQANEGKSKEERACSMHPWTARMIPLCIRDFTSREEASPPREACHYEARRVRVLRGNSPLTDWLTDCVIYRPFRYSLTRLYFTCLFSSVFTRYSCVTSLQAWRWISSFTLQIPFNFCFKGLLWAFNSFIYHINWYFNDIISSLLNESSLFLWIAKLYLDTNLIIFFSKKFSWKK